GADADERAFQFAEALGASGEIADDEQRPLSADDACRPGDGAHQRVIILTGAGGSRGFVCQRTSPCHVSSPPSLSSSMQVNAGCCSVCCDGPRIDSNFSVLYRMIPPIWRAVKAAFLRRHCLYSGQTGWNAGKPAEWYLRKPAHDVL